MKKLDKHLNELAVSLVDDAANSAEGICGSYYEAICGFYNVTYTHRTACNSNSVSLKYITNLGIPQFTPLDMIGIIDNINLYAVISTFSYRYNTLTIS